MGHACTHPPPALARDCATHPRRHRPLILSSPFSSPTRPLPPHPAGVWLDGVEQSLLYCTNHTLSPITGQAVFTVCPPSRKKPRRYDLIQEGLYRGALLHYARQFRHLESSRSLLAQVGSGSVGLWACRRRVMLLRIFSSCCTQSIPPLPLPPPVGGGARGGPGKSRSSGGGRGRWRRRGVRRGRAPGRKAPAPDGVSSEACCSRRAALATPSGAACSGR